MATSEQEWERDRDLFIRDADGESGDGDRQAGPLARQFADLAADLLDATSVAGVLQRVTAATLEVLPGADLASITLRASGGEFYTPVETDPVATELDRIQYDTSEGPCLESARESGPAMAFSADLAHDPRWPRFGPATADRGYHSVLSTALLPNARPPRLSGALNVYSRQHAAFDKGDRDVALLLATHASLAVATTEAVSRADLEVANLRKAIETRDVIGQAKGILMHRRGVDAGEAFDILRGASQDLNIKLTKLAELIATRHTEL